MGSGSQPTTSGPARTYATATGFVHSGPIVFQDIAQKAAFGDSTDPSSAEIHWPSGKVETIRLPAVDRIYTIEEGKGITAALCSGTPCAVPAASAAPPAPSKP